MREVETGVGMSRKGFKTTSIAVVSVVLLALLVVFSGRSEAQTTPTVTIHLDPDTSTVRWTLKSFVKNAHGTFKLKGGDVVANPKTGVAQGEILIDATSGSSGDSRRDAKWQREVLDSGTFPAIIFHPTQMEGLKAGDGTQQVKAIGTMTLHGQDHPVELMLTVVTRGSDVNVTTHYVIPYVQWGLRDASAGLIHYDKQVAVDIEAKGQLKKGRTTPPAVPAPDSQ
jgi:polyisoprenoid-binding protein YceI